ncbi:MAG: hypothetical protein OXJ52_06270 [Oligoflexia bacterium]|nr:hypothetical protein [Oligoflexia bacterium]
MKSLFKQVLYFLVLIFLPPVALSQELITAEVETGGHRAGSVGELVVVSSEESEAQNRDKNSLSYIWSVLSKPKDSKAQLFSMDESKTSFVPDKKGAYVLRLYIYSKGFISEHKDTIVLVNEPQIRPMAVAGEDEAVQPGALVDLDGNQSFHFGSDEDLSYEWVLESLPENSSAQIYFPHNKQTSFYADVEGVYLVRLIVRSKDSQFSLPSYKVVRAKGANINSPQANAGDDTAVIIGEDLDLTGSVTYKGSESLSYEWRIESSPTESHPQLTNPESLTPVFTADTEGDYLLSFQAQAGDLKGAPDFVKIVVGKKPLALVADTSILALTDQDIPLDGSVSFDLEGLDLTYIWTVSQKPQGSLVKISDPLLPKAQFSANKQGEYTLQLVVKNSHFSSDPKTVKIRLISPGSFKAEAGVNQVVTAGSVLNLSASSSLGEGLSYFWSLIEKPSSSHAGALENRAVNAKIPVDKAGAYIFRLHVIKEAFWSDPDFVVFNAVLPVGTNVFSETFRPKAESLTLPISECEEITKTIAVSRPGNKEYFILFENKGVEEFFAALNGKALTGRLEHGDETSVYPVSLSETNSLSVRVRGLRANHLKVRIIEKPSSQSFGTPPVLTAGAISVSLGGSGSVSVGGVSGLTYSVLEEPVYGQAVVSSSGQVTYTSSGTPAKKDLILIKAVNSAGLASVIPIKVRIN